MKPKILLTILLTLLISGTAGAVEMVVHKEYHTETMKTGKDYIFMGRSLVFSGESEDLTFLGKDFDFTGKTKLGLTAFGEDIMVNGQVGNGITSAGENISIEGKIKGSNFLAGRRIVIQKGTVINGAVFAAAAEVIVRGKILGDLYTAAGKVTIEDTIQGNVKTHTGRLMITGDGKISGNLTYSSDKELSQEELAKVTGTVNFEKNKSRRGERFFAGSEFMKARTGLKVFFLVAFIASGFLLLFLPPTRVLENPRTGEKFWYTSLYGLIPLFMYPAVVVISALLVITLPLTGVLLLAMIPLSFITKVMGVTLLGQYASGLFKIKKNSRFIYFLLGLIPYAVIGFIPFLNILMAIFLYSLGFGLIISYVFKLKTA